MPRHQAFPAWGKILRKVALCCPSSAASAEKGHPPPPLRKRVILRRLCVKGHPKGSSPWECNKHADKVEATMLLLHNDIGV